MKKRFFRYKIVIPACLLAFVVAGSAAAQIINNAPPMPDVIPSNVEVEGEFQKRERALPPLTGVLGGNALGVQNERTNVQAFDVLTKARAEAAGNVTLPLRSVLYTPSDIAQIEEARQRFLTRPPRPGEIDREGDELIDPGRRELTLAGIVYRTPKEWTIWFNEQRVTPTAIPEEVLDLKVYNEFIEVKWYDEFTNQIFPIRLRPHQRFNLDDRLFLPGQ